MTDAGAVPPRVWEPTPGDVERSPVAAFLRELEQARGLTFNGYADLWRWSVEELEDFWPRCGGSSAEIYGVVESLPEIADSLVVGVELPDGSYAMPLFVVPAAGRDVDDDLCRRIARALREQLSPRHVPDAIVAAPGIPRTLTGKKLEVPVKRLLQGTPVDRAASAGAVDRPELLAWYAQRARRSGAS